MTFTIHHMYPKDLSASDRTALLDMLDALPNSTSRIVGKYAGVSGDVGNTTGPAREFADRGYTTWGYFYDGDDLATYQGRWTLLGMDYNAPQATWDAIKAYGKPVIGHIILGSNSATTALAKGADGLMAGGVVQVVPPTAHL